MDASLTFEQSFSKIDGDSASSTELYALLSSLSGVPIKQGIAVTGSVNQNGEIQAIGGVNEKIEGFFEICRHKGLTGEQGVMIPRSNVSDLVLKETVREAVAGRSEEGWFCKEHSAGGMPGKAVKVQQRVNLRAMKNAASIAAVTKIQ